MASNRISLLNLEFFSNKISGLLSGLFALHLNVSTFVMNILTTNKEKWLNAYF